MEPQHEQKNNRKAGPQETGAHDIRLLVGFLGLSQSASITITDLKLRCGTARPTPRGGQSTSVRGTGDARAFPCLGTLRAWVPAGHRRHLCEHVKCVRTGKVAQRFLVNAKRAWHAAPGGLEGDRKMRS